MKYAWLTDVHLDFIDGPDEVGRVHEEFATPLSSLDCDGYIVTGDISVSEHLIRHLKIVDSIVNKPFYFVCGNHDFYGGDFETVRKHLRRACKNGKNLSYLTQVGHISLTSKTALVGHDGWYDAYHGDPSRSNFIMNDWVRIGEYSRTGAVDVGFGGRVELGTVMALSRKFAHEGAMHVRKHAAAAAKTHSSVVILTHVPPYPQVHVRNGKSASTGAMPWYTSKLMGDAITEVAEKHPNTRFDVFSGHTHGQCSVQISHNIFCHVGGAEYGHPSVVGMIQVP